MLSDELRSQLLLYVEGELDRQSADAIRLELEQNAELREEHRVLMELVHTRESWQNVEVPEWNRSAHLRVSKAPGSPAWLPWLSLAGSACAILMVLLQVSIYRLDSGLVISFAGKQPELAQKVDAAPDWQAAFDRWQYQQAKYIDDRFDERDFRDSARDRELFNAVVKYSRKERQREASELVNYLQFQQASQRAGYKEYEFPRARNSDAVNQVNVRQ